MKFDAFGNRIAPPKPEMHREPALWYESEKINDYGYCDKPFTCETNPGITHLCDRWDGHPGGCAATHLGEADGRKIKRLEQA